MGEVQQPALRVPDVLPVDRHRRADRDGHARRDRQVVLDQHGHPAREPDDEALVRAGRPALIRQHAVDGPGGRELGAFGPLARNANKETRFALPHRLGELGVPTWLAITLFAAAFALAYLWLAREAWRGRARLGLAAALLLLAVPYLAAWYVVWTVPLAAAEDDRTAQLLALGLTAYLLRQAVPI